MPLKALLRAGECVVRWHLSYSDAYRLYGKYMGNWGDRATRWRFEAVKDGKTVASVTRSMGSRLHLEVKTSHTVLREGDTYDASAVRLRLLDENGTLASYAQLPLTLTLEGEAELVGPAVITAEGGMAGTYVRTLGRTGTARLRVAGPGLEAAEIIFTVVREKEDGQ